MFKTLPFILLLFLPELISARGAERPVYILRPVLPERMEGLKISLEIRTLPINDMGTHKKICILSTNMVNRNHSPVRIKISYYYQDEQKEKLIEIAGNQ